MSLRADIDTLRATKKKTKSEKILKYKDEVEEMLELKIPLKKQIELLVKNDVVEKITITEYRRILELDFDYLPRSKKRTSKSIQKEPQEQPPKDTLTAPIQREQKRNPAQNIKELLSREFTLEI